MKNKSNASVSINNDRPVSCGADGVWNLTFDDSKSISGLRSSLKLLRKKPFDLIAGAEFFNKTDDTFLFASTMNGIQIETEIRLDRTESIIKIAVAIEVPKNGKPVFVDSVELVSIPLSRLPVPKSRAEKGLRFWRNWHDIWYEIGSKKTGEPGQSSEITADTAYLSGGVYSDDGSWSIIAMYQQPCLWQCAILVENEKLIVRNLAGVTVEPGRTWHSDRIRIAVGLKFIKALETLHLVHLPRRKPEEAREHFGWNTWEAYHGSINSDVIMENANAIAAIPWLRDRIRYITIDDGWERRYGDWIPNDRFPEGMDGLAKRIASKGFQPGIWTAPFLVHVESDIVKNHSEYLLHDGNIPILDQNRNILDPTHPGVRAFVFELYHRLRSWGYRYFKTDFLRDPAMYASPMRPEYRPGLRLHDPELGIARGMRAVMQAIRAGIGEDAFWLGCGTDIASGALLMDGSRIGGDIIPYWTRVPYQARSVIHNFHLHGHLFLSDPDFLLVKGSDTCLPGMLDVPVDSGVPYVVDEWKGGRVNGLNEVHSWSSLVILSGGLVNLSDKIKILNAEGLKVIRNVLELAGGNAACPIDMATPIPRILLRQDGPQCLLGIFNWSNDQTVSIKVHRKQGIPFPESTVIRDVWSDSDVYLKNDSVTVKLPPRCVKLFKWSSSKV